MIKIIQRRKIWFAFSLTLFVISIAALAAWGLKLGIDFTGGTLIEFSFKNGILNSEEIKDSLKDLDLGEVNVQFSGEKDVLLRFKDIDEDTHQKIIESLELAVSSKNSAESNNKTGTEEAISAGEEIVKSENAGNLEEGKSSESANNLEKPSEENNTNNSNSSTKKNGTAENNNETINNTETATKVARRNIEEKRFDSIGPVIGSELKNSAVWATVIALIAIVLYIGWAFRKVSRPISSFKYGIAATAALFHDVIITLGVFSVLGHFYNVEIGVTFVAAILAILGYSVNDTIIVFDRTRENLLKSGIDDFEEVVNKSVNETMVRSLNTSFTTLLVLFALYLFGGETIKYFVVALLVGIAFGTYSSIFIASPLLVSWQRWSLRRRE